MKKPGVLLFLTLCACSTMQNYQPKLGTPVTDSQKYSEDLSECRKIASAKEERAAHDHNSNGGQLLGIFGASGAAASATVDSNPDTWKLPATLINECLISRGYDPK